MDFVQRQLHGKHLLEESLKGLLKQEEWVRVKPGSIWALDCCFKLTNCEPKKKNRTQ